MTQQNARNQSSLAYGKINALGIAIATRKVVFLTTFPSNIYRSCLGGNMKNISGVYEIH